MTKYVQRARTVDAVQWYPPGHEMHNAAETPVVKPAPGQRKLGDITCDAGGVGIGPPIYSIKTPTGQSKLDSGDWIVSDSYGRRYSVPLPVFDTEFDPAELQPSA